MTWTIGLGVDDLESEKYKGGTEWKINDNDHGTFKRKIQCVGSATGFFFPIEGTSIFLVLYVGSLNLF